MDVITTHINADFDAVGSMVAAKKLYPNAVLVFSGGEGKSLRDFFIQSTLYSLNIETVKDIDLEKVRRLIIVDTRQRDRIGEFASIIGKNGLHIHVYDHHPPGDKDIVGTEERVERTGACVTIMSQILQERKIDISPTEATLMALGLYEDTGSLTFNSTTPEDLRAAAFLVENGANLNTISDIMANTLTGDQIHILSDLLKNLRDFNVKGHRVSVTEASIPEFQEELAVVIGRLREIENLEAVFALIRGGTRIHLIGRSRVEAIDCSKVARHFGGGGHKFAAAATIKDMTLIEAREALQSCIYSVLRTPRKAHSIMSYPVKTIGAAETVEEARQQMIRYNVAVLPVLDGVRTVGYITRSVVSRAIHHQLQDRQVQDFMTADIVTADPETPFSDLYSLVVGRKQRVVPVVDGTDLVGVVTRTDILNHLLDEQTMGSITEGQADEAENTRPAYYRDLKKILESTLPKEVLEACKIIGRTAEELGMSVYLVGGFVRDLLLKRENLDVDFVVEGDAIMLADKAAEKLHAHMAPHHEFKTASLTLEDGSKIDFATARLEYYEQPAALPIVEASSIKLDLMRRDFTINTLIIAINPDRFGELCDFFGAYQDIRDGQIRVLHNLSFIEDPTRIIRAIRFEQRFGFTLGRHTLKLLKTAVRNGFLERVDGKRLIVELRLVFDEEEPLFILRRLDELRVLEWFHPRLRLEQTQLALLEEVEDVLSWYEFLYLDQPIEKWRVWILGLVGLLKQKQILEVFDRLELLPKYSESLSRQKQDADVILHKLSQSDGCKNSQLYRLCKDVDIESLLLAMAKANSQKVRKAISLYLSTLKQVHPDMTGQDLKFLGFKQGPIYSEILEAVLDARLDNFVANRDQEIAYVIGKFSDRKQG